jgi:hypothetical protein
LSSINIGDKSLPNLEMGHSLLQEIWLGLKISIKDNNKLIIFYIDAVHGRLEISSFIAITDHPVTVQSCCHFSTSSLIRTEVAAASESSSTCTKKFDLGQSKLQSAVMDCWYNCKNKKTKE